MVHAIVAAATLTILTALASGEVDFTPKDSFYMAEGTKVPNVAFQNGTKKMTYSPPADWTLSGGGRKLTLTPLDKVQAGATLQTDPVSVSLPATEENVKAYTELAIKLLPQDAAKVTVVSAAICPLRISDRGMVEITLTYALFGQQFTTNMLLLPYEKERISFQITARNADYPTLSKIFRASLFSFQGL